VEGVGEMRITYKVLVGKHEGKRNLEDLSKGVALVLKCSLTVVWEYADRIRLTENENLKRALAEKTKNCRVP
jgi:hypothetical protein